MTDKNIAVCLSCEATVDMGACLCPDGGPGDVAHISYAELTAWREGQKPEVFGDGGDQGVPVHSLSVQANPLKTKGPETVSLRDEIARIIDPEAWEEYLLEDGRVDEEVASIFQDAFEVSRVKADSILSLLPPKGWRPIESAPFDRPFLALGTKLDIRRCWRFRPSSRTDEILSYPRNGKFAATHWMEAPAAPVTKTEGGGDADPA